VTFSGCFIALGDYDKAGAVVRSDIVTGPNSQVARNSMVFVEADLGD
jgi:hypothetical protein